MLRFSDSSGSEGQVGFAPCRGSVICGCHTVSPFAPQSLATLAFGELAQERVRVSFAPARAHKLPIESFGLQYKLCSSSPLAEQTQPIQNLHCPVVNASGDCQVIAIYAQAS